jgi:hypothetical protein
MANPFTVAVPNIYEALMAGDQGYKGMRGVMTERDQSAARKGAEQALLSGGDTRSALARLIGAGDMQGAQVLGSLGKADTTDEIKEYNLAKSQGFKGSFFDFKTQLKREGATRINNSINTGEKAYDTKLGGAYADRFLESQKAGQSAVGQIGTLDIMDKLTADPNFYSGVGAEKFALPLKQAISRLGGDPNAAAPMEAFRSLSSKATLDSMGGSLGAGFSNADRDFVISQVPSLQNTPEGNKQLIQITRKVAERNQQIAKLARDYAAKNGRLDEGFDEALSRWAEANPMFKSSSKPQTSTTPAGTMLPATKGGVKWELLD